MGKTNPIKVLAVDDHPMIRDGIAYAIQKQPDMCMVGEAGTGEEALRLFQQCRPDVALVDIRVPDICGTEIIEAMRSACA